MFPLKKKILYPVGIKISKFLSKFVDRYEDFKNHQL